MANISLDAIGAGFGVKLGGERDVGGHGHEHMERP